MNVVVHLPNVRLVVCRRKRSLYGYVVVNKPELKFREFDVYRSYYCGLCKVLGKEYGFTGKISLSYDMTFLIMLLSGLYEPKTEYGKEKCLVHLVAKHEYRINEVTDYVADMNILMMYYKCMDDWNDEHKVTRKILADSYNSKINIIRKKYENKARIIESSLKDLSELEAQKCNDIDRVSYCFGKQLAAITAWRDDEWHETLSKLGFFLGKYIYILDAYDDLEKDVEKKNYNMLIPYMKQPDFDNYVGNLLNSIMAECARYFERLPIINDVEILRNIIYSGVWTRFDAAKLRHEKKNN